MRSSAAHPPEEDLIALVLGEADASERTELEAHIDACEPCRREYVGLVEALGTMAYAAPTQAPPPHLRATILDAAAREPRSAAASVTAPGRSRRAAWRGWSAWAPRIALGAGGLAAIVFAVLVFTNSSPATHSVALQGVTGSVVVTNQSAVLESKDFAPLPAGHIYEMWIIHDGAARPAGLFYTAVSPVMVGGKVDPGDTVAVTREPAGGSAQPTMTPIATAAVPAA